MDTETDPVLADRCAIAIMAKAPLAGRSKTRLCPPLRLDEAAALSGAFLRDMAGTVLQAGKVAAIDLFVAYAPAGSAAGLAPHVPSGTTLLVADGAGIEAAGVSGFGLPLLQTVRLLLGRGYGAACVLNSDSPTLSSDVLVRAAALLCGDRAVMGPAEDGGYYLLGMTRDHPEMFAEIEWSTATVAARTRAQALGMGLPLAELPPWYDVDDAASLRRMTDDLDRFGHTRAPATAAMLVRLDVRARLSQPA